MNKSRNKLLDGCFKRKTLLKVVFGALILMVVLYFMSSLLFGQRKNTTGSPGSEVWTSDNEENHDIPMENLYYPKRPEDLWFKLSKPFVIRRLGYFDSRRESEVSVVFITMHDDRTISKPKLYASLVYKNKRTIACIELEEWAVAGKMKLKTYEYYVTYIYRTKIKSIPTDEAPLYARVGLTCTGPMASIPIQDSKPEKHLTYGVCLHQGLYGSNNSQLLIDWIELNIALGAEIITVYFQDVPESYYNAMLPYIKKGIVEVLDWGLKPPLIPGYTRAWGQTGLVNECIYRNLYRVKYLALMDVDEFFIPSKRYTVVKMLKDILKSKKAQKAASFILYNTWFYDDGTSLPEVATATKCINKSWPRYFTFTQRASDPVEQHKHYKYHKMIVKVKAVIGARYHWPIKVFKSYSKWYRVPPKYGLLHHYRVPAKKDVETTQSFIMSRYFDATVKHLMKCQK